MFMCTYASSQVKRKSFYRKKSPDVFVYFRRPYWCTKTVHQYMYAGLQTKLYKGAWNVSANNSKTVGHKDLRLGKFVWILVFYNISFSWLLPLDGFQFIFFVAWQWKRSPGNDLWAYLKWTKCLFSFTAWCCIETTCIEKQLCIEKTG